MSVICILDAPCDETDLNEIIETIDRILPEEYLSEIERRTNDR